MLRIRLTRVGRKNLPHYRIVVAEHTEPVKGKFIEILGNYSPLTKATVLDGKKALQWMNKGAKPSNMVAKIMKKQGLKHKSIVIEEFHKKPKTEAKKVEATKPVETATETEKPVEAKKPMSQPKAETGPSQTESANREEKAEQPITETPEKKEEKPVEQTKEDNKENKSDVSSQGQPTV